MKINICLETLLRNSVKTLEEVYVLQAVLDNIERGIKNEALKAPLERFELSVSTQNILYHSGCETLGDVTKYTAYQLITVLKVPKRSVKELIGILNTYDLKLREE